MALPPIPHEEIASLLAGSAPAIQRHVACIGLPDNRVCSGVYVKCFGYDGILTAGHCAWDFLAGERFALCISEAWHQLWVRSADVEHVPVGWDDTEGPTKSGPDLSFITIPDKKLRDVIVSQGIDFYDLDGQNGIELFANPFRKFNWSVAGSPNENVLCREQLLNGQAHNMVWINSAVMQGNFYNHTFDGGFDYIELHLLSTLQNFPGCYNGVSGGGIWYQALVTNGGKNYRVEPILAGIACWQSEHVVKRGYKVRKITGHGWVSVYEQVPRIIAERRRRETQGSSDSQVPT